ncbi:MAG TPA: hypothetical protein P5013_05315 [Methanoregula sp.]|nr:hypothetical protein [Methanoregula sp.]
MARQFPVYNNRIIASCLLVLLALMLITSGCTQPSVQQQTKIPPPVTATQTDSTHILIAYPGSTDTSTLLELEATVTDSAGKTQTQSVGSHLSTTPLRFGATIVFDGMFSGTDHVFITGYFMDGSQKTVLDTTL